MLADHSPDDILGTEKTVKRRSAMLNKFCKKPLYEVTRTMAKVATGAEKADLVIKNARPVNVCTCEIQ